MIDSGETGKIITHGASNDLANKHYAEVMRIAAELNGKCLYKALQNHGPVSRSKSCSGQSEVRRQTGLFINPGPAERYSTLEIEK